MKARPNRLTLANRSNRPRTGNTKSSWNPIRPSLQKESQKPKKIRKSLQYLLLVRKFHQQINYKNIKLLKAFLTKYGKIRPRRKTRLSIQKQAAIAKAIRRARAFRLIPFTCDVSISR